MDDNSNRSGVDSQAPVLAGVVQITIKEGMMSKVFYIAQTLLDAKAPRFQQKIATPGSHLPVIIKLEPLSVQTFASFVKWLETQTLEVDIENADHNPLHSSFRYQWPKLLQFIKLHKFAEKYNIIALSDDLQRKLSTSTRLTLYARGIRLRPNTGSTKKWFFPEMMAYIYDCTSTGSSLRDIVAATFCSVNASYKASPEVLMEYRKDFLIDVIVQSVKATSDHQVRRETTNQGADRQRGGERQGEKRKRLS